MAVSSAEAFDIRVLVVHHARVLVDATLGLSPGEQLVW